MSRDTAAAAAPSGASASSASSARANADTAVGKAFLSLAAQAGISAVACQWTAPDQPWKVLKAHERVLYATPRDEALAVLLDARAGHEVPRMRSHRWEELRLIAFRLGLPVPSWPVTAVGKPMKPTSNIAERAHDALAAAIEAEIDAAKMRNPPLDGAAAAAYAAERRHQVQEAETRAADLAMPCSDDSDSGEQAQRAQPPDRAERFATPPPAADARASSASVPPRSPHRRQAKDNAAPLPEAVRQALLAIPDRASGRSAAEDGVYAGVGSRSKSSQRAAPIVPLPEPLHAREAGKCRSGQRARRELLPSSSSSGSSSDSLLSDSDSSCSSDSSASDRDRRRHGRGREEKNKNKKKSRRSRERRQRHRRRRDSRVRAHMEELGFEEELAPEMLENMLRRASTAYAAICMDTFKSQRNQREATLLARVIDLQRSGRHEAALELLCRRLAGVRIGDRTGSWEVADALEGVTAREADLPESSIGRIAKRANSLATFAKIGVGNASGSLTDTGGRDHGASSKPYSGTRRSRGGQSSGANKGSGSHKGGSNKKPPGGAFLTGDSGRR